MNRSFSFRLAHWRITRTKWSCWINPTFESWCKSNKNVSQNATTMIYQFSCSFWKHFERRNRFGNESISLCRIIWVYVYFPNALNPFVIILTKLFPNVDYPNHDRHAPPLPKGASRIVRVIRGFNIQIAIWDDGIRGIEDSGLYRWGLYHTGKRGSVNHL